MMNDIAVGTKGALSGVRVLDLSRFIAGPLCCQILGDMGAEVIKVERPGGEDARRHAPFYNGMSIYSMLFNRNKRGVTLDTRHPDAVKILESFIEKSHLVVQNYRPGTLEAMGLDYERMRQVNPNIILVSISGFGQTGPNASRALFDAIAQAESGLMSLTGAVDDVPMVTGAFISDYVSAYHGAIGALTALLARARTGEGQHVDVSCIDALFTTLGTHPSAYAMLGEIPERTGNRDHLSVPANVFKTSDGHIFIHGGTNTLFPKLARAISQPELAVDERFRDHQDRIANTAEIEKIVSDWTARSSTDEVAAALAAAGVPFGRVASVPEAVDSAQVAEREMIIDVEHPVVGQMKLPGMPIKLSGTPGTVRMPPPLPGEHNDDVYAEVLGLSPAEIAAMRSSRLI